MPVQMVSDDGADMRAQPLSKIAANVSAVLPRVPEYIANESQLDRIERKLDALLIQRIATPPSPYYPGQILPARDTGWTVNARADHEGAATTSIQDVDRP